MNRVVFSTDQGRHCPDCGQPIKSCRCSSDQHIIEGDGIVRLQLEKKGRKGKGVTLISGIPMATVELKKIAKELKQHCGTGGAVKKGIIEIQGDQRSILEQALLEKGYRVKIIGA